jgi:type II secretory pathway pseudopilin PulG
VNRARPAYTLFEVVLVLALLVILAALAYPSLDGMYADFKLTQAADQLRACWSRARAQAIDEGRSYRFCVLKNKGNFRAAPDSSDFWSGSGSPAPSNDPNDQPLVIDEALPKGIRFSTPENYSANSQDPGGDSSMPPGKVDSGSWTNLFTFLPNGTASDDVDIVLDLPRARPVLVRLRGLTGSVIQKPFRPEDKR